MNLSALDTYLRELLRLDDFARIDASWNGVQIECSEKEIAKVAVAVDAAAETAARAARWGADVLFVHHGLFWGSGGPITGIHYNRVRAFLEADIALYAVHLPLDAHEQLGNNARMAQRLRLSEVRPFGAYKGTTIGVAGSLPEPMTNEEVARALFGTTEDLLGVLPFGPERNQSVGIISGGAPRDVVQAIDEGLDLFVTGDALHTVYHNCLEAGINSMFGGHYRTETWGVQAVAEHL
ncbi:MAG: Nif3-like dinuclear metal center hexameric protein, partial [Spirochaetota bacterium]